MPKENPLMNGKNKKTAQRSFPVWIQAKTIYCQEAFLTTTAVLEQMVAYIRCKRFNTVGTLQLQSDDHFVRILVVVKN